MNQQYNILYEDIHFYIFVLPIRWLTNQSQCRKKKFNVTVPSQCSARDNEMQLVQMFYSKTLGGVMGDC